MKNNISRRLFSWLLVLMMACSVPFQYQLPVAAEEVTSQQVASVTAYVQDENYFNKGNVYLDVTTDDILAKGYAYGDIVNVSFLNQDLSIPLVSSFSDVDSGTACLIAKASRNICLAINGGSFETQYGLTTDLLPVQVEISMKEQGGYYDQYIVHHISYVDDRAAYAGQSTDYPALSDAEFANFRCVSTTGMGKNILYRSATPINPKHNRSTYADAELKKAAVTVVMNLSDTQEEAAAFEGFASSYYATTKVAYVKMNLDFTSDSFCQSLAPGLRFFAQNPGVYDVHCLEGKDRTGFVIALLECFMGASADEVVSDYMVTYYNYYGITKDDVRYNAIANSNIVKTLQRVYNVENLYTADLKACASTYIKKAGLTDAEIIALRDNLRGDDHTQTVIKNKKAATYKSAGYTGDTYCKICGKLLKKGKTIPKLTPKKQTIKVSKKASKTVTYRYKKLRRRAYSFWISAKAQGKITYKVTAGHKKYIKVTSSGKVTLKKRAKKGTYKITVSAAATKDGKYKKATKTITIKVR